jgi:hypothetical protein
VIVHVCELGRTNITMAAIEAKLKAEGYRNSGGQPWLSPNDGCVVVRILMSYGIAVNSEGAPAIAEYVLAYGAKLAALAGKNK